VALIDEDFGEDERTVILDGVNAVDAAGSSPEPEVTPAAAPGWRRQFAESSPLVAKLARQQDLMLDVQVSDGDVELCVVGGVGDTSIREEVQIYQATPE